MILRCVALMGADIEHIVKPFSKEKQKRYIVRYTVKY